jgi:ABC-type uncharacterized transport system auxiliary subunit
MRRLALVLLAAALGACSMPSRAPSEPELYLVRARGAEVIAPTAERAVLRVAPVAVAAHIRGVAIVTDDGRVRTMVNQGFAAPLHSLVEEAVTDRLRASNRFGIVLSPAQASSAPFTLRLTLRSFEIAVTDAGYVARVAFDGMVERDAERRVIRTFRAAAERPAEGPARGGFVKALEDAMNGAIDGVLAELEAAGVGAVASQLPAETEPASPRGSDRG